MTKQEDLLLEELPFTVSARAARLIGQENFANAEGAIIELIKNSYDADATICLVVIDTLSNSINVFDNGDGMEQGTISKHWMTIGTDDKRTNVRSNGKRIRTGAKGIGRFALDRLGKSSRIVTKPIGLDKLVWSVDWEQFNQSGAVIQDVKAKLYKSSTSFNDEIISLQQSTGITTIKIFSDVTNKSETVNLKDFWQEEKGTLISISNLKDEWDESAIESLFANLQILVPPLDSNIFRVHLISTQHPEKFGTIRPTACDDYDYKVTVNVSDDRLAIVNVSRNELNVNELKRIGFFEKSNLTGDRYSLKTFEQGGFSYETSLSQLVAGFKAVDKNNNLEKIGPFTFSFYFMKRGGGEKGEEETKYPYKRGNYRDRAKWLDTYGGIKIYRDNFRIRPYGETKGNSFDWLGLGSRSVSSPTVTKTGYRVRPNQVYGIINISRIGNINFDDKSGREGLQENETFTLFKELLKEIISVFENDRNQIMIALKKISDERDKKRSARAKAEQIIKNKNKKSKGNTNFTEENNTLIEAIEGYKDEIDDLIEEQKLLRVLASAGLIVTSFAHELKNLSDSIVPRTEDLRGILENLIDEIKLKKQPDYLNPYILISDMRTQDERLKTWLDFSLSSVRKDKRTEKIINMVTYIEGLERMWSPLLSRRQVSLKIDKWKWEQVNFHGHEIDLDGIFNNLIANSIDAFKRQDAGDHREIRLSFSFDPNDQSGLGIGVVYEDTGPGLESEILDPNQIFQPFFTTKRDERTGEKVGTGLGMWIVKSVIDEYEGEFNFLQVTPGFKVKIVLPHL